MSENSDAPQGMDLFGSGTTPSPSLDSPLPDNVSLIPPPKRGRRLTRTPGQRDNDLFALSMELSQKDAKAAGTTGFLATAMVYASLPHSSVEGGFFERRNGDLNLTIMCNPRIGLPYGKIPRIVAAFLCTEAKRERSPIISLGRSLAEFADKLGMHNSGGERGDTKRLREQATRLFCSRIQLIGTPGSQFHWNNLDITEDGMTLWNPHTPEERSPWESELKLSTKFFEECIAHPVPIDLRVLHALRSPLAIDIYVWLTYRLNSVTSPTPVTWKQLKWQFGSDYADDDQGLVNFVYNFRKQLRSVQAIYSEARVGIDQYKLTLLPSKPHVLPAAM